jgi:hypothetical protein
MATAGIMYMSLHFNANTAVILLWRSSPERTAWDMELC